MQKICSRGTARHDQKLVKERAGKAVLRSLAGKSEIAGGQDEVNLKICIAAAFNVRAQVPSGRWWKLKRVT